ncbi:MAG: hypothetical protein LBU32_09610 [Clostridiales bacterium]|jgi:hypothetical protein|nr:hypothetical protein [Clostridiales bacterium]
MISTLQIFSIVLLIISSLTTAAAVYVFGVLRSPGSEPEFFLKQNSICKVTLSCILALGWIFGNPLEVVGFAAVYRSIGLFWFFFGIVFLVMLIVGLFTNASKTVMEQLRKFGFGDLVYGLAITSVTWLLWG